MTGGPCVYSRKGILLRFQLALLSDGSKNSSDRSKLILVQKSNYVKLCTIKSDYNKIF
jgi:hypothetical protein